MTYYVISPNVWDGVTIKSQVDFMLKNHVVCMDRCRGGRSGDVFAKIKPGDRVIVAHRKQWKWKVYFIAIADGHAKYDSEASDSFSQICNIRSIVDVRYDSDFLDFLDEMTGFSRKNPGSIFRLHQENAGDRRFISELEHFLQQKSGDGTDMAVTYQKECVLQDAELAVKYGTCGHSVNLGCVSFPDKSSDRSCECSDRVVIKNFRKFQKG